MHIDHFLEYFGRGFSSIDENRIRQIIRLRVPTFLKIEKQQFSLDPSYSTRIGILTDGEKQKMLFCRDFFAQKQESAAIGPPSHNPVTHAVQEEEKIVEAITIREKTEDESQIGLEQSKADLTKYSVNLSEVDPREKNMKLFSKEYVKISGKIRKLTVFLDYETDSFLFKTQNEGTELRLAVGQANL